MMVYSQNNIISYDTLCTVTEPIRIKHGIYPHKMCPS